MEPTFSTEFGTAYFVFQLIVGLLSLASLWIIFQKAGIAGWKAIVPIYNFYKLLHLVGKPGWWLLLLLVPLVNIIVALYVTHLVSLSFGKDLPFTLGLVFLPFVFYPILAFGDAQYQGDVSLGREGGPIDQPYLR